MANIDIRISGIIYYVLSKNWLSNNNNPFPTGSQVAAYLRDSGGSGQETSIQQQLIVIRDWVFDEGLVLTHVFKDEARPGSSVTGRDGFQDKGIGAIG